jgi:hypothetical protein
MILEFNHVANCGYEKKKDLGAQGESQKPLNSGLSTSSSLGDKCGSSNEAN